MVPIRCFIRTASLLLLFTSVLFSEPVDKLLDLGQMDVPIDILQTLNGDLVITGYTGTSQDHARIIYTAFIVRLNPEGDILWKHVLEGEGSIRPLSISEMHDGSIILVGNKHYWGTPHMEAWAAKLSAEGEFIWKKDYKGPAYTEFSGGIPLVEGKTITIGRKPDDPQWPIWLAMIEPDGSLCIDDYLGGVQSFEPKGLQHCLNQGFLISSAILTPDYKLKWSVQKWTWKLEREWDMQLDLDPEDGVITPVETGLFAAAGSLNSKQAVVQFHPSSGSSEFIWKRGYDFLGKCSFGSAAAWDSNQMLLAVTYVPDMKVYHVPKILTMDTAGDIIQKIDIPDKSNYEIVKILSNLENQFVILGKIAPDEHQYFLQDIWLYIGEFD